MEESRLNDGDFEECLKYLDYEGKIVKLNEVEDLLACLFGENDGSDWHYIIKLKNGKYAYVHAGCDYTGWGCQEWGDGKVTNTIEEAINEAPETEEYQKEVKVRQQLKDQIEGKQPYGLQI